MNREKREALRARATTAQVLVSDWDLLALLQDSAELERLQADTWQARIPLELNDEIVGMLSMFGRNGLLLADRVNRLLGDSARRRAATAAAQHEPGDERRVLSPGEWAAKYREGPREGERP